ncbi:asparaginase [Caballeronia sp. GAFFF3]|uniref:asparaginase n=1 Tax=Caballeronia sp. GAFFF3 TaxID=2921759 RepID=UPI002027E813|nr:asparaginase [Caballeronia sp. GAFFF3]
MTGEHVETSVKQSRIAVIGTGGTFAMHGRHRFDWIEYADSGVIHPLDDLLKSMGELSPELEIVPIPFRSLGSVAIGTNDWLELARLIRDTAAADPSLCGFVITHGTATMEETAWFLDQILCLDMPVVLTGAQRPGNTDGSDAPANLRSAMAVANDRASRGLGVLVVMGGLIFAARDVTKAASFELAAFEAPPYGPLGRVDADASVVYRRLPVAERSKKKRFDRLLDGDVALPRVDISVSYAGADGAAIRAFAAAGARGIVCAGLTPGRIAAGEREAILEAVDAGVTVVQSTRSPRGVVPVQRFLTADGLLAGGDLSPQKLRITLILLLALQEYGRTPKDLPDAQSLQRQILDA